MGVPLPVADDLRVGIKHVVAAGANFQVFIKLPGTAEVEIADVWNCGVQLVETSIGKAGPQRVAVQFHTRSQVMRN